MAKVSETEKAGKVERQKVAAEHIGGGDREKVA